MDSQTQCRLQQIKDTVASRDWVRTHWEDCMLTRGHRDCAIAWLVGEVERLRCGLMGAAVFLKPPGERERALQAEVKRLSQRVDNLLEDIDSRDLTNTLLLGKCPHTCLLCAPPRI